MTPWGFKKSPSSTSKECDMCYTHPRMGNTCPETRMDHICESSHINKKKEETWISTLTNIFGSKQFTFDLNLDSNQKGGFMLYPEKTK